MKDIAVDSETVCLWLFDHIMIMIRLFVVIAKVRFQYQIRRFR